MHGYAVVAMECLATTGWLRKNACHYPTDERIGVPEVIRALNPDHEKGFPRAKPFAETFALQLQGACPCR